VIFRSSFTSDDDAKYMPLDAVPPTEVEEQSWLLAIKWLVVSYVKNLWFILRSTLPLMILAGVLGVMVVTFIPLDKLTDLVPTSSYLMTFLALCITALVGVFLPVPITCDVIVTAVLLAAGMPVKYAMILLFTLGIFSIYSYLIVHQAISRRVGLTLFFVIAALGVMTGFAADEYDQWYTKKKEAFLFESWASNDPVIIELPAADPGAPASDVPPGLVAGALQTVAVKVSAPAGLAVAALPLSAATPAAKAVLRIAGQERGND